MHLDNGLTLSCIEPGKTFRFGAKNADLEIDLTYEAIMKPLVTRGEPPFNHGNHIDQPGRVRGHFVLQGEEIPVDCFAMRDRSWGIRRDGRQPQVGYCYAIASEHSAFLSISVQRQGVDGVLTGFLMRDGVWSKLRDGTRTVERDSEGRPAFIHVEARDALGRQLSATGEARSRQVFTTYPSMFCWNSLVRWDFEGAVSWGEDQDIWHPRRWREHIQQKRHQLQTRR
jgi:hypothetical protein